MIVAKASEPVVAPPATSRRRFNRWFSSTPAAGRPHRRQRRAVEMSLGSSLIASGMLRKPVTAANDPLAPIRRMSQAEKIAFFS